MCQGLPVEEFPCTMTMQVVWLTQQLVFSEQQQLPFMLKILNMKKVESWYLTFIYLLFGVHDLSGCPSCRNPNAETENEIKYSAISSWLPGSSEPLASRIFQNIFFCTTAQSC